MIRFLRLSKHSRPRELLSAYVDGEVSAKESALVEGHLDHCQECRGELESLRATVGLLRRLPVLAVPRSFTLAVAPEPVPTRPVIWTARLATSVAALLLVALLLGDLLDVVDQRRAVEPIVETQPAAAPAPALSPATAAEQVPVLEAAPPAPAPIPAPVSAGVTPTQPEADVTAVSGEAQAVAAAVGLEAPEESESAAGPPRPAMPEQVPAPGATSPAPAPAPASAPPGVTAALAPETDVAAVPEEGQAVPKPSGLEASEEAVGGLGLTPAAALEPAPALEATSPVTGPTVGPPSVAPAVAVAPEAEVAAAPEGGQPDPGEPVAPESALSETGQPQAAAPEQPPPAAAPATAPLIPVAKAEPTTEVTAVPEERHAEEFAREEPARPAAESPRTTSPTVEAPTLAAEPKPSEDVVTIKQPSDQVREPEGRKPERGLSLPLWQLELAVGSMTALLAVATFWLPRRKGRRG